MHKAKIIAATLVLICIITFFWGAIFWERKKVENAPRINFKSSIDILVSKASFERGNLHFNDLYYVGEGISPYSKFYTGSGKLNIALADMSPPYRIYKISNSY